MAFAKTTDWQRLSEGIVLIGRKEVRRHEQAGMVCAHHLYCHNRDGSTRIRKETYGKGKNHRL